MKNRISHTAIILIVLSYLIIGCKESGTNPNKTIKTPREMTWTADTLTSPDPTSIQLMMNNILVFSPNDVWVCGWSDVARGLIWHYDGNNWKESNIAADVGGMRVNDIAGYNSSNLWTVGYSGNEIFIARYDGQHWTRQNNMGIKGELLDMSKDPSGNLWACGRNGVIMKYDKTKWMTDVIKVSHYSDDEYFLNTVTSYKEKVCSINHLFNFNRKREVYHLISGDIGNWIVVDSIVIDQPYSKFKWGEWRLFSSEFSKLYSVGQQGVWLYNNVDWNQLYQNSSTIYGISGPGEDYLIAVGDFQQVLFYNGISWENVVNLFPQIGYNNFVCRNVWTNGYETFIIGYGYIAGNIRTIIFHGK
jgi:hypothetical protein